MIKIELLVKSKWEFVARSVIHKEGTMFVAETTDHKIYIIKTLKNERVKKCSKNEFINEFDFVTKDGKKLVRKTNYNWLFELEKTFLDDILDGTLKFPDYGKADVDTDKMVSMLRLQIKNLENAIDPYTMYIDDYRQEKAAVRYNKKLYDAIEILKKEEIKCISKNFRQVTK